MKKLIIICLMLSVPAISFGQNDKMEMTPKQFLSQKDKEASFIKMTGIRPSNCAERNILKSQLNLYTFQASEMLCSELEKVTAFKLVPYAECVLKYVKKNVLTQEKCK